MTHPKIFIAFLCMNIFQSWKKLSFFSKKKFLSKELFQKNSVQKIWREWYLKKRLVKIFMKNKGSFRLNTYFSSEFPQIYQKNGYLGICFIKREGNFWNGGLLKKTEFVLSNEFWQHCLIYNFVMILIWKTKHKSFHWKENNRMASENQFTISYLIYIFTISQT